MKQSCEEIKQPGCQEVRISVAPPGNLCFIGQSLMGRPILADMLLQKATCWRWELLLSMLVV